MENKKYTILELSLGSIVINMKSFCIYDKFVYYKK